MITENVVEQIKSALCESIVVKEADEGIYSIDVPLEFPDGDACRIYASRDPRDAGWEVFDDGDAVQRASYVSDTDVRGPGYVDRFRQITEFYGIDDEEGELILRSDDVGKAAFSLLQATVDVVNLARSRKQSESPSRRNQFTQKLANVVAKSMPSDTSFTHNWVNKEIDDEGFYPVDYRVEQDLPLYIFGAGTKGQCVQATMSCLFHRSRPDSFRSVAIFEDVEKMSNRESGRLSTCVDHVFPSFPRVSDLRRVIAETSA